MKKLRYGVIFKTWHRKTVKFAEEYNARLFARHRSKPNGVAVVVFIDNDEMKKVATYKHGEETSDE